MTKPRVVFLVGPTACGKTATAVELAKKINAEIISADSMQVYRGLNILSAKPDKSQRRKVRQHLIDILEPEQEYSAAIFCEKAAGLIKEISAKGKVPLIVGGTGLYVRSLAHGIFADKGKDEAFRERLFKEAEEKGNEFVYKKLVRVDPKAAEKVHPNNLKRVNKGRFSDLKLKVKPLSADYDVAMFGLSRPRAELYARIEERVDEMFRQGVVEEIRKLNRYKLSVTINQAIGIKQINACISKDITEKEAVELIKKDTRRFAKRQLTWFRNQEKELVWIDVLPEDDASSVAEKIYRGLFS